MKIRVSDKGKTIILALIPLFVVVFIIIAKAPTNMGLFFRYEFNLLFLLPILMYLGLSKIENSTFRLLRFGFVLIIFLLPLFGLWKSGMGEMQEVGGRVFFSDSARYYFDTLRFLEGFQFSTFSARHPIFTSFLATLLALSGRNFQLVLGVLVLFNAISAYVLTEFIRKIYGSLIATMYLFFLFLFLRRFIGYPNPENMGVLFGMIGLWLLLVSIYKENGLGVAHLGLLMMTIGLCARPGTYFILPAIATWIALRTQKYYWRQLLLSFLVIVFGFGLNTFVLSMTSPKEGSLFSNFSYHLYGLSIGGQGWEQAFIDHPELKTLSEVAAEEKVFSLAINEVATHPSQLLKGILRTYSDFFSLQDSSVFGFVRDSRSYLFGFDNVKNLEPLKWIRVTLTLLSMAGIVFLVFNRKDSINSLLLFCIPAILLSVPFLPPRDSAMMRVYATTMPIILLYPLIGVSAISRLIGLSIIEPIRVNTVETKLVVIASISYLLLLLPVPALFRQVTVPIDRSKPICPANQEGMVIRLSTGSSVTIINDNLFPIQISEVTQTDFLAGLNTFYYKPIVKRLSRVNPPTRMANVINLENGLPFWVVLEGVLPNNNNAIMNVCGNWDLEMEKFGLGFFIIH